MNKRISIVTICLNNKSGLMNTWKSIVSQQMQDYEWIVIDGCSEDGTIEWIKENSSSISKWVSEFDDGIYDAMNKGADLSSEEYVLFLNSGDLLYDEKTLSIVINELDRTKGKVDILFGGAQLCLKGKPMWERLPKVIENYIWHGLPAIHQSTVYRQKFLKQFKYSNEYKLCGDYYMAARFYTEGANCAYINRPISRFELGGASYNSIGLLFLEPFQIQRDILRLPFVLRILSVLKRCVSTLGLRLVVAFK